MFCVIKKCKMIEDRYPDYIVYVKMDIKQFRDERTMGHETNVTITQQSAII